MSSSPPAHNGILLVDKEAGWTSHDVVAKVRGLFGQKRVGHTGTLDPAATGLLVVCLGRATRLVEYMTGHEKVYSGVIRLGVTTETDDAEGKALAERPVPPLTEEMLKSIAQRFTGVLEQVPPQYSAVKTSGVRAYAVARRGGVAPLAPRQVVVHELALQLRAEGESLDVELRCGAGTYVRSLARDIGEVLGCGAHLASLRRLEAGPFSVDSARTLEVIGRAPAEDRNALLLPLQAGLSHLPCVRVTAADARRLADGLAIKGTAGSAAIGPIVVTTGTEMLVGIATHLADGTMRCTKVLAGLDALELA